MSQRIGSDGAAEAYTPRQGRVIGRIALAKRRLHVLAVAEPVSLRAPAGRLERWLAWTVAACVLGSALLYSLDTPFIAGAATPADYDATQAALAGPKVRVAVIGTLGALVISWVLQRRRRIVGAFPRELAIGLLLATALFAAEVASSSAVPIAAGDLRTLLCMVGVMLVCGLSPRASRLAMGAIVAAGVAMAVVLLAEERGLYLPALGSLVSPVLVRPTAMMPHRNVAADYLFIAAVLLAGAALSAERRRAVTAAVLFGVVAAALTATASRSALAATLLAALYLAYKMPRRRRWAERVAMLLVAATLAIALRGWKGEAGPYSLSSKMAATLSTHDYSRRERLALARFTLEEIVAHPLFGEGRVEWQRRWDQAHPDSTLVGTDDSWLDLAVAYGLPCMLVVGVGAFGLGRRIWRAPRGDGGTIDWPAFAVIAGALPLSFFSNLIVMPGVNVALGVVLGVVVSTEQARAS